MLLKAEKATALPDDCDFVRAHASLTTFTMSVNIMMTKLPQNCSQGIKISKNIGGSAPRPPFVGHVPTLQFYFLTLYSLKLVVLATIKLPSKLLTGG